MLSPLVLLNGDAYDFGVVIINETQNLREIEKLRQRLRSRRYPYTRAVSVFIVVCGVHSR
jgi:hypothetical protein